jgi:hypothetical protein
MSKGAHDERSRDDDPATSPFARFEDLVKRLISVPKGEVDELQRAEEKKRKKKRPEEA